MGSFLRTQFIVAELWVLVVQQRVCSQGPHHPYLWYRKVLINNAVLLRYSPLCSPMVV